MRRSNLQKSIFKRIIFFLIMLTTFIYPFLTYAITLEDPAWVYKGRGDKYIRSGEIGQAIVEYKKAILKRKEEESGGYPEVHLALASIYYKEQLYNLALFHLKNAENERESLLIPDLIYDIWYLKADIYSKQGKISKMIELYQNILKNDSNSELYKTFNQKTYNLLKNLKIDEESQKKFGKAYFEVGKIKAESGNYENAVPYLAMAITYRYNPEKSLENLVNCYINMGNNYMVDYIKKIFGQVNAKGL